MTKITIAEGGPAFNVGSMALIENAIKLIRSKYGDCEITVLCSDAQSVTYALQADGVGEKVTVLNELFLKPKRNIVCQSYWLFVTVLWFLYSRLLLLFTPRISWAYAGHSRRVLREIEESECVFCIGAERVNDVYFKSALLALYSIGTYIMMGKKVVHMSLTVGPVFYKSTIRKAKEIFKRSHAIFVRDSKSYDILKSWGCSETQLFNVYDIALFQDVKPENADDITKEFGLEEGFIGVSALYWRFSHVTGPARQPEYNRAIADTLDYIIEKYNRQIVFTPTVTLKKYPTNDIVMAETIISMMKHPDRVVSVPRLLTPCELATLYTKCLFSIVTRMHAAILCSGAGGKPIIAVNYLYKLREYMKNIGFEDYSVDIDYVSADALTRYVDRMFDHYTENKNRLNTRIEEMRSDIRQALRQI